MKIPVNSRLQSVSSQSASTAAVKTAKVNAGDQKRKDLQKTLQDKMKEQEELKKKLAEQQNDGFFGAISGLFGDDGGVADVKKNVASASRTKVRRFPPD